MTRPADSRMPPADPDTAARPPKTSPQPGGISLDELVSAEVAGLQVFLDTLRYDPESNQVWLLSISGQSTAVRGAWANLTGFHSYLKVLPSEQLLTLASGGLGWRTRSARLGDPKRLGRAWEHIVLLPPCTETWGHIGEMLIVERPDRDRACSLMNLLAIRSSLPLDSGWKDEVWAWAADAGAIHELAGHGPAAWLVRLSDELLMDEFLPRFARVEPAADRSTGEVAA
jgi:hypothetical protein